MLALIYAVLAAVIYASFAKKLDTLTSACGKFIEIRSTWSVQHWKLTIQKNLNSTFSGERPLSFPFEDVL